MIDFSEPGVLLGDYSHWLHCFVVSRSCFIKLVLCSHAYGGGKSSDPVSVQLGGLAAVAEQVCGYSSPNKIGHLSEVIALSLELGVFYLVRFKSSLKVLYVLFVRRLASVGEVRYASGDKRWCRCSKWVIQLVLGGVRVDRRA